MAIKKRSLSMAARVRNFVHMLRYEEDCRYVEAFGADQLLQVYLSKAQLAPDQESKLKSQLEERLPLFNAE